MSDPVTANALKDISKQIQEQNRILKDINRSLKSLTNALVASSSQEALEAYVLQNRPGVVITNGV